MPLVATGRFSLPLLYASKTLAACATWQTITDSANEAAALTRISYFDIPQPANGAAFTAEELETLRPFAVVGFDPPPQMMLRRSNVNSASRIAGGSRHTLWPTGEVFMMIECAVPTEYRANTNDAMLDFCNTLGAIASEMEEVSGTPDYLALTEIEFTNPTRASEDQVESEGDYIRVWLRLAWD